MEMETGNKKVVLIAVDDSKESMYSLEWALDHLLAPASDTSPFKLILIHVKALPVSVVRFSGTGMADVISLIEMDIKKTAASVMERANEICVKRSVSDIQVEVVEGDARLALCEAVENHQAHMLIMGSHGYGAFKRAILGSVSDYCAHHAHCSVLIVKKPKAKAEHRE